MSSMANKNNVVLRVVARRVKEVFARKNSQEMPSSHVPGSSNFYVCTVVVLRHESSVTGLTVIIKVRTELHYCRFFLYTTVIGVQVR